MPKSLSISLNYKFTDEDYSVALQQLDIDYEKVKNTMWMFDPVLDVNKLVVCIFYNEILKRDRGGKTDIIPKNRKKKIMFRIKYGQIS